MVKIFKVYKQEFKFKVSYLVTGEKEDYLHKDAVYMGKIRATSKPDAAAWLKAHLGGALSHLPK